MYQAQRGTADILPEQQRYWSYVTSIVADAAQTHGYSRIDTPVFEDTGLFARAVGGETDIVQKEMYSFKDRGGVDLTLRPEGTAAICRAYLEHGLHNLPQPVRLFYLCPMFRYDRPQAGRFRQFHQFGVEAIGDGDAAVDLEVIQLAMGAMEQLGLGGMSLVLNNIGDAADRPAYIDALREHFRPHLGEMGTDDRRRFDTSPLRLLDSKELEGRPYTDTAPKSTDFLGPEAKAHWEELLGYLDALQVPYRLDSKLVRGLDYYTRTVFEVHPAIEGAQSAICAGGRYDGLMEQLGGKPTPGIGFAAGIERIILNLQRQEVPAPETNPRPIVIAYRGTAAKAKAVALATGLRRSGVSAVAAPDRSLKAQMRYASAIESNTVLILGDQEIANGVVTLRDMATAQQEEVAEAELAERLAGR
ncbi:MAG: histidine--tRNA ligase [Dehalococcoidia bacterium]